MYAYDELTNPTMRFAPLIAPVPRTRTVPRNKRMYHLKSTSSSRDTLHRKNHNFQTAIEDGSHLECSFPYLGQQVFINLACL
jgi:hypothetical protein